MYFTVTILSPARAAVTPSQQVRRNSDAELRQIRNVEVRRAGDDVPGE